jgi:outer membrane autotransporter protein
VTLNNRWRFGFAAGGGSTSMSVAARASNGTIDTAHMAAYGGTQVGAFAFKGGLAYARHDITTTRTIAFGTFGDFARASYHGSTSQVFAEAAWRAPVARLALETFANVAYIRASTGSFTEAGGPAALRVAGVSDDATYTTLGIRGSKVLAGAPWPVVVAASLGWQHAWTHSAPLSAMAFADSPGPFIISGVPIASDALATEASADALIRPNTMLGVSYSGRVSGTASSHAAKARFIYQF